MNAKSIRGDSPEEIDIQLKESLADGFRPTLAFVFCSIQQNIPGISKMLDQAGITIFGATSAGEFIDGKISHGAISILMMDMDPANFILLFDDYNERDHNEVAASLAEQAVTKYKNPALILSYSVNLATDLANGEPIIRSIESIAGTHANIWGGGAGDDLAFIQTEVFTNNRIEKKGIILLAVDAEKVTIHGMAASGQKPVGTEKTLTKVVGNIVYEIDHQPATEMVIKYLGLKLTPEEAEKFNPGIIVFSLLRPKGNAVMRSSGIFNWKNKSIAINASIKEGDKIRLTLPPDFEVIEEVSRLAQEVKSSTFPEADALLMFSCVGRLGEFGPMAGDEIEGVRNVFNVPLAGFFTYGEFGRATDGNNEFHNNTCCWVGIKEK
jgi:hypothetical protein